MLLLCKSMATLAFQFLVIIITLLVIPVFDGIYNWTVDYGNGNSMYFVQKLYSFSFTVLTHYHKLD